MPLLKRKLRKPSVDLLKIAWTNKGRRGCNSSFSTNIRVEHTLNSLPPTSLELKIKKMVVYFFLAINDQHTLPAREKEYIETVGVIIKPFALLIAESVIQRTKTALPNQAHLLGVM